MAEVEINNHAAFIWSIADLLRGDYKQSEYGKVILPLTVLRRLDCVLEPTKAAVIKRSNALKGRVKNVDPVLENVAGQKFFNTSQLDFRRLLDDPTHIAGNLRGYIASFSAGARDVIEKFDFDIQITRLAKANLLYQVIGRFADIDLHPDVVSNVDMGAIYEELIRKFSELSNETAGEHFTPREVVSLMVNVLFAEDSKVLTEKGVVRTMLDPACGTGGMLSVSIDHLRKLNPTARLEVFGEEVNDETYAVCCSDMLITAHDTSHIIDGNSFTEDGHKGRTFDYLMANPPFGVEWKKVESAVRNEHENLGFKGRFGAGLPRINDGSFLFLQHMMSKMKPAEEGGSRVAIVFNGSPLFSGAAASEESEIRRWIIENDWLETVVALPDQLFYNTGISTYFWIVTNRKRPERRGKVQLVDARDHWVKMQKSLGDKRKKMSEKQIEEVTRLYADFAQNEKVKILANEAFGYQRITVEQPLRLRWDVTNETIAVLQGSKVFEKLNEEGWSDLDAVEAPDAFKRIIGKVVGRSYSSLERLETDLASATIETWTEMGWEIAYEAPSGTGSFAKALEVTPTLARKLLHCFAVRDPDAPMTLTKSGSPESDPDLRDNENVPLPEMRVTWVQDVTDRLKSTEYLTVVEDYVKAEVLPYAADAWVDHDKTRIGYEIPLTRHFYRDIPPRSLFNIDADMQSLESQLGSMLRQVDSEGQRVTPVKKAATRIPWLEERPSAWEEVKLTLVARLGSGHTPSREHPEWWEDCTIPWITTGEVAQMRSDRIEYIYDTREKISEAGVANSSAEVCPAGTVVLCRTASAGYSAIMGTEMATSQDFATWTCGPLLRPRFLLLCLRAMRNDLLGRLAMGSTHKTIYMPDIEALRIPLPPVEVQDQIVDDVWRRLRQDDLIADTLMHQADLLNERRDSLLKAAMQGDLVEANE